MYNLHTYIRTWYKPRTYRVEIGITYIHTYGLGTSQDPTYIEPQYKKKTMYVEISIHTWELHRGCIIFKI